MSDTTKRSKFDTNFEEVPYQFFRTFDTKAHEALHPHLKEGTRFVEPCAGYGDLINGMQTLGHECVFASELVDRPESPKQWIIKDALELSVDDVAGADCIITNPPWKRPILHSMIQHFVDLKPTWLIFEADWMHTKQSAAFMSVLCTDVVSVGRVKWIEGSKYGGLKDCAWYRFSTDKNAVTRFFGR